MCIAASSGSGRRRRVLERIRAKREMSIKTEDSGDMLLEHNDDSASTVYTQTNMYNAVSPTDVKSLIAEYVLR